MYNVWGFFKEKRGLEVGDWEKYLNKERVFVFYVMSEF